MRQTTAAFTEAAKTLSRSAMKDFMITNAEGKASIKWIL
jgi:hypothetical protein